MRRIKIVCFLLLLLLMPLISYACIEEKGPLYKVHFKIWTIFLVVICILSILSLMAYLFLYQKNSKYKKIVSICVLLILPFGLILPVDYIENKINKIKNTAEEQSYQDCLKRNNIKTEIIEQKNNTSWNSDMDPYSPHCIKNISYLGCNDTFSEIVYQKIFGDK